MNNSDDKSVKTSIFNKTKFSKEDLKLLSHRVNVCADIFEKSTWNLNKESMRVKILNSKIRNLEKSQNQSATFNKSTNFSNEKSRMEKSEVLDDISNNENIFKENEEKLKNEIKEKNDLLEESNKNLDECNEKNKGLENENEKLKELIKEKEENFSEEKIIEKYLKKIKEEKEKNFNKIPTVFYEIRLHSEENLALMKIFIPGISLKLVKKVNILKKKIEKGSFNFNIKVELISTSNEKNLEKFSNIIYGNLSENFCGSNKIKEFSTENITSDDSELKNLNTIKIKEIQNGIIFVELSE